MKLNTAVRSAPVFTHEGGKASHVDAFRQLKRSVLTCLLWEKSFYESGSEVAKRIALLVPQVEPTQVVALACEARDRMNLRHVPLFLVSELSKIKGTGRLVADTLQHVIQRADELSEFLAIYWKDGKHPISKGVRRGLAAAFPKFDAYQLAKYNRDGAIKLRDVLFLTHPKPATPEQAEVWKKLTEKALEAPDTWEVQLSAGKDKKETFERLIREGNIGGLALLRNLRGMQEVKVDSALLRERLKQGAKRAFPYRFVVAAKYAPNLEDVIEIGMLKAIEGLDQLPGRTILLIDVSGSMDYRLGQKESETFYQPQHVAKVEDTSRIDVACGLAILIRELAEEGIISTFSTQVVPVPPRRGFALRDAVKNSQAHGGTALKAALSILKEQYPDPSARLIVITDEQSQDGVLAPWMKNSYIINVASNKNGVGDSQGWRKIEGWSEQCVNYIREMESLESQSA